MRKKRYVRTMVAFAAAAVLVPWLGAPVGEVAGKPLRMMGHDGADLGVAALTVSMGPDQRWLHLGDAALTRVPPRWLYLLQAHQAQDGQEKARTRGWVVAAELLGVHHLEQPEGVSAGEVRGTSSGLAWALATLLLNDSELRTDGVVYATGSLYGSGSVGAIAGLEAKLRTPGLEDASWVFVPASQYRTAVRSLQVGGNEELAARVVGVNDVGEALKVLCRQARQAPTCRSQRKQESTSQRNDAAQERGRSTASPH
jgi:hypothetical protein